MPLAEIGRELLRRGIMPRSGRLTWGPSTVRHIALTTPDDISPIGEDDAA